MFERFTEKAIKVIMLAQEENRRLGHNLVGTEFILLGLIGEGTGIAAKCLKSSGINLKDARIEVENIVGRGAGFTAVEIPFTANAKRQLELAWDEARQLGNNYISTEHLLLGLIRIEDATGCKVLQNLGADIAYIRAHVIRLISEAVAVPVRNTKLQSAYMDAGGEDEINNILFEAMVAALPPETQAKALNLREVMSEKMAAYREQEFEKAASLREKEGKLKEDLFGRSAVSVKAEELNFSVVGRLSNNALKTIMLAREETNRLGHKKLGTAQIVLGLIAGGTGITSKIFETFSVNLESAREAVEKIVGKDSGYGVAYVPPFTPRAGKALESAWAEAKQLGVDYIDNEHLLLGILREGEGVAVPALRNLGVNTVKMQSEILRLIGESNTNEKLMTDKG